MMLERILVISILFSFTSVAVSTNPDYRDALAKSLIFFQGQRSGKLPHDQKLKWRSDSGLRDGSTENVNLTGGYYDAGDNVKFGLPMAFTTTMLAWSVLEFGKRMSSEVKHARQAVRWGTDYLLEASSELPNALYVQVGDPTSDHKCWQRAEDIKTPKPVYKVTPSNPGSDVAGETAAALAAASLVFKNTDKKYSKKLLETAEKAFTFADTYKGSYSDSLSSVVCPFYCSYSGYQDELLWASAWLYRATKNSTYLNYALYLGGKLDSDVFSWDNKLPGAVVLLARNLLVKKNEATSEFNKHAETFMCSILPDSPAKSVQYTPGGLLFKMSGSNLQYVTSSSFLLITYAKYLKESKKTFSCDGVNVTPDHLTQATKKQVDYILGANPKGISYMVGFGRNFPQRIHHRGASIPSIHVDAQVIGCDQGFDFYHSQNPDPNVLTGAVIGGPDENDEFSDDRDNYAQSEPATYINAPLVGSLAYLAARYRP